MEKIAILSPFRGANFGTLLQAYSLYKVILEKGYACEYIDFSLYYKKNIIERILQKIKRFLSIEKKKQYIYTGIDDYSFMNKTPYRDWCEVMNNFTREYIPFSNKLYNPRTIYKIRKKYSKFIVGSDQTWSYERNFIYPLYFLPFIDTICYSYAPSIGTTNISEYHISLFDKYISKFKYLSCRELTNANFLSQRYNVYCQYVVDPTLLISKEQWLELAEPILELPQKYILVYALGERQLIIDVAEKISNLLKIPIIYINTRPKYASYNTLKEPLSPFQFIYAINNADFVITDSFHGTLFSINLEKNFYSLYKRENIDLLNDNGRIDELLSSYNLLDRLIKNVDTLKNNLSIDYSDVSTIVKRNRVKSLMYIDKILLDK